MSAGAELSAGNALPAPAGPAGERGGRRGARPRPGRMDGGAANAAVLLRCLLSLLFLAGTPVPLNASPEALPTVQLSNASLAVRPGSRFPELHSLPLVELCVSVPLANLLWFLPRGDRRARAGPAAHRAARRRFSGRGVSVPGAGASCRVLACVGTR